jgi:hypothetical protein
MDATTVTPIANAIVPSSRSMIAKAIIITAKTEKKTEAKTKKNMAVLSRGALPHLGRRSGRLVPIYHV